MVNFLVRRNTQLPHTSEFELTTSDHGSPLEFYEGERPHVKYCKFVGKLMFIKPFSRYGKIKLVVNIDAEGVLTLTKSSSTSENNSCDDNFVW